MIHERDLRILNRLRRATAAKLIRWTESNDGWFSCTVGGREISFRFLYFEATNQPGADRQMIELIMPGRCTRFACGTEGFDIVLELLGDAFQWNQSDEFDPLRFLDEFLPET